MHMYVYRVYPLKLNEIRHFTAILHTDTGTVEAEHHEQQQPI